MQVAGSNAISAVGVRTAVSCIAADALRGRGRALSHAAHLQGTGSAFTPMTNAYGAAWQQSNFGLPPFDVQISLASGASVIARSALLRGSSLYLGKLLIC